MDEQLPAVGNLQAFLARHPRPRPGTRPKEPPPNKPRLTVLDTIYYQAPGDDPVAFKGPFARLLESEEQPCIRKLVVGEPWQAVEGLWLSAAGLLGVRNDEGTFTGVIPTPEQRQEVAARIVEVGVVDVERVTRFAFLRPGESCRFEPADMAALRLRCQRGQAKVTVAAFPL